MLRFHQLIATAGGIGFIGKGAGTIAAFMTCLLCWFLPQITAAGYFSACIAIVIIAAGVYSSGEVDRIWGKDSSKVVIDEVAGMLVTLLFIPVTHNNLIVGLLLFRFFDIAKPFYIKRLERLPKGWGVMADDVLAAIYAHIVLLVLIKYNLF